MRVLIVEEESLLRLSLGESIAQAGHTVLASVTSTGEALLVARNTAPSLVLIGLDPRYTQDGIRLARALEKLDIPSLFIATSIVRAREGADAALGVISKPVAFDEIPSALAAVGEVMSGRSPSFVPQMLTLFH